MKWTLNNFRTRKVGDNYFVTTDHGSYCILSEIELRKLRQNKIDDGLRDKLSSRGIMVNDINIQDNIRLLRNRNNFLFHGTSLHIIVVTLRCNMNCIYCHASSKPVDKKDYDMDERTAKKTVDFILQSPNNNITIEFQGGEPLLNWDIVRFIIEYARKKNEAYNKNIIFTMVTNLTKMDEEKMEYLIKNKVDVCTSLDGPKKLHDYNRKFTGGSNYDQVVFWIKRFNDEYMKKKIKNRSVHALVTLTRRSMSYPKGIVDEYVRLGLKDVHLRFLNNLGVASVAWKEINYSIEDYLSFWKSAAAYIVKLRQEGICIKERMVDIMFKKINNEFDPNYLDLRSPCGAAIGQLTYNYNGDIYTCDEARMLKEDLFLLGNVKKDSYKDIVTCDKACVTVAASINSQYICNDCAYKPYCGLCPVCNYAEQGSVIAKISETNRCKIFKAQFDWVVKEKFIKNEINN